MPPRNYAKGDFITADHLGEAALVGKKAAVVKGKFLTSMPRRDLAEKYPQFADSLKAAGPASFEVTIGEMVRRLQVVRKSLEKKR